MDSSSAEIQNLLDQMQDIVIPGAVGWFPLSSSLLALAVGLMGFLMAIIWMVYTSKKANAYRLEAKTLYDEAMLTATSPQEKIEVANRLLKQVAITHYGRKTVANLSGESWVKFLQKTANYIDQPSFLKKYLNAHYQAKFEFEQQKLEAVLNYVQNWMKGHHK